MDVVRRTLQAEAGLVSRHTVPHQGLVTTGESLPCMLASLSVELAGRAAPHFLLTSAANPAPGRMRRVKGTAAFNWLQRASVSAYS